MLMWVNNKVVNLLRSQVVDISSHLWIVCFRGLNDLPNRPTRAFQLSAFRD